MKIIAMITARSTSRRFPRKHLAELGGKPMIVQIINNIKALQNVDEIVLATTTNPTDMDLSIVAQIHGAKVFRGSEDDLIQRHGGVLKEYGPDAILDISGDCPFMDILAVQEVVNAMREKPDYDCYGISGPYARNPEMLAGGHAASYYKKAFEIFEKHPAHCSRDQYWLATALYPHAMSTYTVDGSKYFDKTVTPMKLSIDWKLELHFFNAIIDHLGFYPMCMADFDRAFEEMKDMKFTWRKE